MCELPKMQRKKEGRTGLGEAKFIDTLIYSTKKLLIARSVNQIQQNEAEAAAAAAVVCELKDAKKEGRRDGTGRVYEKQNL